MVPSLFRRLGGRKVTSSSRVRVRRGGEINSRLEPLKKVRHRTGLHDHGWRRMEVGAELKFSPIMI